MQIFLSYASEDREIAEKIANRLELEDHKVFFDREGLKSGKGYDQQIRQAINGCDLLIFLISPDAVAGGRYTLTELKFAKKKWRNVTDRILPVVARETPPVDIPAVLSSLQMIVPEGNLEAEVVAQVAQISTKESNGVYTNRLQQVNLLAQTGGAGESESPEYATLLKRAAQERRRILVIGEFGHGRENLLNALAKVPPKFSIRSHILDHMQPSPIHAHDPCARIFVGKANLESNEDIFQFLSWVPADCIIIPDIVSADLAYCALVASQTNALCLLGLTGRDVDGGLKNWELLLKKREPGVTRERILDSIDVVAVCKSAFEKLETSQTAAPWLLNELYEVS